MPVAPNRSIERANGPIVEERLDAGEVSAPAGETRVMRAPEGARDHSGGDVGRLLDERMGHSRGHHAAAYRAMLVASVIRNFDDAQGGLACLSGRSTIWAAWRCRFFLVLALMTLRLGLNWARNADGRHPGLSNRAHCRGVLACVRLVGADYDAAVMGGGLCGFMLGNGQCHGDHGGAGRSYGPAPRAFLVVPMVGAFFIDFVNAVIITVCLNIWS
jgi:hypothetical protein